MKDKIIFLSITFFIIFEIISLIVLFFLPIETVKGNTYGLFPHNSGSKDYHEYYYILSFVVIGLIIYLIIFGYLNIRYLKNEDDDLPNERFIQVAIILTGLVGVGFNLYFLLGNPRRLSSSNEIGFYFTVSAVAMTFLIAILYFSFLVRNFKRKEQRLYFYASYDLYHPERL